MLRDSVPPWSSHSRVYITAVSKDLVRRPTRISYDLSLATYRTNWGCLLADSGTIAGSYSTVAGRPSMFVLRSMRKHPEILADVSVNHSRTGAVKLLITRRTSQSSSSSGYRSPTTACPGGRNWAAIQPRSKRMTRPCARVLCSRAVSWAMPVTLWEPWTPGRATWPASFSSIAAMYLSGQRYCAAISGASRLGPNVDGVAGRIQRSELLPSRDACGLSNRARRTPVRAGLLRDGRQRWGRAFRRRGRWFPESGLCSHRCGPWACGSVLPRVARR